MRHFEVGDAVIVFDEAVLVGTGRVTAKHNEWDYTVHLDGGDDYDSREKHWSDLMPLDIPST